MDANTITAICATVIAVLSLIVSFSQTKATQRHNRQSVRPLLEFRRIRQSGSHSEIVMSNNGLGPAILTSTTFRINGHPAGDWNRENINRFRDPLPVRAKIRAFPRGRSVPAGFEAYLIRLDGFDPQEHAWFWELVNQIELEFHYESFYGERFTATLPLGTP